MNKKACPQVTDGCVCVSEQSRTTSLHLKASLDSLHPITFVNLAHKTMKKNWSASTHTLHKSLHLEKNSTTLCSRRRVETVKLLGFLVLDTCSI